MHPLGLCNNNDEEDLYEYGWVGVVKLEQPELDPSCLTVLGKTSEDSTKSCRLQDIRTEGEKKKSRGSAIACKV
ncbi:E3 ubiquitin-protein ligase znrf3 [Anabarilius grahami]|uniref:RING-type E3 ubiquitin transferase n=1 Tax=Anabarilius grahami TaxID=495550 RepID=A0A3N0XGW6_ANAGA|nr:E3 ubiquitin-protein ligase znrf3 [Anabarilius grahami]